MHTELPATYIHCGGPRRLRACALLLACACALLAPVPAIGDVAAPATRPAAAAPVAQVSELLQPRLAGQGLFTWFGIRIYEASLWVGPAGYQDLAAPLLLELRYARALNGRKIAEASAEQMAHIGAGSAAQRAAWLETMRAIFPDVRQDTLLSGALLPGRGVRFYLDGKLLAQVDDAAFAQAFFGIWLSPATSAPQLRAALLRDATPRP